MDAVTALPASFLLVFFFSLLFEGIDRKLHARMQKRIGPPIVQPFYDLVKLFSKERIVPITASPRIFVVAPMVAASSSILGAAIPMANIIAGKSIVGDLILILYLLTMFPIAVMIGASSSGNPYGAIGFSRKMTMLIAHKVPTLISITCLAFNPRLSLTYYDVVLAQAKTRSMLAFTYPSVAVAATTFLLCMPAAAVAVPFDVPEAKTEIAHGFLIEYGGPCLALAKLAKAASNLALTFLIATIFFYAPAPLGEHISLGHCALPICLLTALGFMVLTVTVPRTVFARLKVGQAFKFYWSIPLALSVLSVLLSITGA